MKFIPICFSVLLSISLFFTSCEKETFTEEFQQEEVVSSQDLGKASFAPPCTLTPYISTNNLNVSVFFGKLEYNNCINSGDLSYTVKQVGSNNGTLYLPMTSYPLQFSVTECGVYELTLRHSVDGIVSVSTFTAGFTGNPSPC